MSLEIYEREKALNKDEPVRKMKGRPGVKADGMEDFNPDSNLKLTKKTDSSAKQQNAENKKGGCCK